jgi:biopolymer transport protein ExbD/biopolymer transport protein TolR
MGFAVGEAGGKKGKTRPQPTINVTPLVDVILVVLIIFMLVTPMMMKTFWLNIPKAVEPEKQEKAEQSNDDDSKKPLVMTVAKDGVVRINDHVIAKSELKARIPRLLAAKENKVLYFDANDEAPYSVAMEAMDLSRAAGAHSIAIMTQNIAK